MALVKVSISLADQCLDKFSAAVKELERAGLAIESQNPAIGVVSGTIEAGKIGMLRTLKEVAAVEESRRFQLPDRKSKLQ